MPNELEGYLGRKPVILVADDEEALLVMVRHVLLSHEFEVHLSINGNQLFDILEVHSPDMILMDIRMKDEDWDKVIETNLSGAFFMVRAAAKVMMKQRSGSVVNISSVSGVYGNAGQANYSASKAGLIGLTKSVAKELGSRLKPIPADMSLVAALAPAKRLPLIRKWQETARAQ